MGRILAILAVVFGLVGLAGRSAEAKPKVAVLGLEVAGAIDATSTAAAHDVTEGLRAAAKKGGGPFSYAPNSDKELIDEKVIKTCDSEGPLCMSEIGRDVGTDVLIYGQLVKGAGGYVATLHVLDVRKKQKVKDLDIQIPAGEDSDGVRAIGRKAYGDLVPGASTAPEPPPGATGTLNITANVDAGSVFVDDDQKDSLANGFVTLTLPEGRYRVAIEAPGHRRKEKMIKVAAGDTLNERFELAEGSGGGGGGGGGNGGWRTAFFVTAGAAVLLGGYSLYEYSQELSEQGLIMAVRDTPNGKPELTNADCGTTMLKNGDPDNHFHNACSAYHKHLYSGVAAIGVGVGALALGYMAFLHHKSESSATASRAHRGAEYAVVPAGAGAAMIVTW